jgi:zinc transporter 2
MFWVALFGIVMNLVLMKVLSHGDPEGFAHAHSHGGKPCTHGMPKKKKPAGYEPPYEPPSPANTVGSMSWVSAGHGHDEEQGADDDDDDEEKNLAVRAAMAHVIGDLLQSIGVCIAAALIWAFHGRWLDRNGVSYWYRADPICIIL